VTQIRCYETTGRPVFITVVLHRRIPYLKNLVGQVAPQALPDAYETTKFLFRSDWTLAARGAARVKLHKIQSYLGANLWLVGVASSHDYPGNRG